MLSAILLFFYYSTLFKYLYLILISLLGVGTFLYSLTYDFNKPQRRALRGTLFLIFELCTGVPILHMAFFGDHIEGYSDDIILLNWYFGGISFIVGALFIYLDSEKKNFRGNLTFLEPRIKFFMCLFFLESFSILWGP